MPQLPLKRQPIHLAQRIPSMQPASMPLCNLSSTMFCARRTHRTARWPHSLDRGSRAGQVITDRFAAAIMRA